VLNPHYLNDFSTFCIVFLTFEKEQNNVKITFVHNLQFDIDSVPYCLAFIVFVVNKKRKLVNSYINVTFRNNNKSTNIIQSCIKLLIFKQFKNILLKAV